MSRFCTLPWNSLEVTPLEPEPKFCCWAENDADRATVQQKFLADAEPTECAKCWRAEAAGQESRRIMQHRLIELSTNTNISEYEDRARNGDSIPYELYQIKIGNTCNGACTTCGPKASSNWNRIALAAGGKGYSSYEYTADDVDQYLDYNNAVRIELLGGEPFLHDVSWHILERLEKAGSQATVSFVTNGSIPIKRYKSILEKYPYVDVCISIDGLGPVFEYLRYPLKWDLLLTNLDEYRKVFRYVSVSYTESNLNVHRTPEAVAWFDEQGLPYIINKVRWPFHFAPDVQPGHEKWNKFVETIEWQDRAKGIHIKNYLPEVWEQINE